MIQSKRTIIAVPLLLAVTGGFLIAIPRWLFPTCGYSFPLGRMSGGMMMHCDTTGTVTISLGMVTLISAVALLCSFHRLTSQGALLAVSIAAFVLFPLYLVWPGVCKAATMPCRIGTLPAVLLIAGIQLLAAVIALVAESRSGRV
jgi:hypothetical protein